MDTTRPSLLLRLKDPRDAAAWEVFDQIYRPLLLRYAKTCGATNNDAEDIVQQCMSAISSHISEFEYDPGRGRFKGWLRTIVNNKVRNLHRDRRTRGAQSDGLDDLESKEQPPDEEFDRLWRQEHLWHCLRHLSGEVEETTYRAFEAYVIEERPVDEICAELNIKPNLLYTIKWRMTERIADKMRELLGDDPIA